MALSRHGYDLRTQLAELGIEVTPDQFEVDITEADERIRPGSDGRCVCCHRARRSDGSPLDFRFGLCDQCAFGEADG